MPRDGAPVPDGSGHADLPPERTGDASGAVDHGSDAAAPDHVAGPAPIADGVDRPLDPRIVSLQRTTGTIAAAVVAAVSLVAVVGGFGAAVFAGRLPPVAFGAILAAWAAVNATLLWHLRRWPSVTYRHASYRVDPDGIEIRHGVIWRRVVNVPRSRVQHTDVSQGPLERKYGLGTLVIYTAGTDHARVALPGLAHDVAFRIREHLLPGEAGDAV